MVLGQIILFIGEYMFYFDTGFVAINEGEYLVVSFQFCLLGGSWSVVMQVRFYLDEFVYTNICGGGKFQDFVQVGVVLGDIMVVVGHI